MNLPPEALTGLIGIIATLVSGAIALFQWRGKLAAEILQAESDQKRQQQEIRLAEIHALRQSEASNDANVQRALTLAGDLSCNIQANTAVLTALADRLTDVQVSSEGFRRENQVHMATEKDRHDALLAALAPLPRIEENLSESHKALIADLKRIGDGLHELKRASDEHGQQVGKLFSEFQVTGTKLLVALEDNKAAKECRYPAAPEPFVAIPGGAKSEPLANAG